jgi:hypothetical protein
MKQFMAKKGANTGVWKDKSYYTLGISSAFSG